MYSLWNEKAPWTKYLRGKNKKKGKENKKSRKKKKKRKKRINATKLERKATREKELSRMISDLYEAKAIADENAERAGKPRLIMGDLCRGFLMQKYGIKSLAEEHLYNMTGCESGSTTTPYRAERG